MVSRADVRHYVFDLPRSESKPEEQAKLALEYWKAIIGVQTHFNDLIARFRLHAATVGFAAYGAITTAYTQGIGTVNGVPVASLLYLLAVSFIGSLFYLEKAYYYRLLLGAVYLGEEFEERHQLPARIINSLSKQIPAGAAKTPTNLFYFVLVAIGIAGAGIAWLA